MTAHAMASSVLLNNLFVVNLPVKNKAAQQVIYDYASGHAVMDLAIGLAGYVIPGGTLIGIGASLVAQIPLVYNPMVSKLAAIYTATPDASVTAEVLKNSIIEGAGQLLVSTGIVEEFGVEFLQSIAGDIIPEAGMSLLGSAIPFIGPIIGAGLDAALAATLTWRVGTMTAMYFQNGGEFPTSKAYANQKAKQLVGHLSAKPDDRVDFNHLADEVPEIMNKQIDAMMPTIKTAKAMNPAATSEQIAQALLQQGFPPTAVAEWKRRQ